MEPTITHSLSEWICISAVIRTFPNPDGTQRKVYIKEYLNTKSITRSLDPQSGTYIRGKTRYIVITQDPIENQIIKTREMNMEELYDNHPWFFAHDSK